MRRALFAAATLTLASGILGVSACASSGPTPTAFVAPNLEAYATSVDPFLGKRCASLDCHGQAGRPLRLYSARGFRRIAPPQRVDENDPVFDRNNYDAAARATGLSPEETLANFQSVVGLQPELMTHVIVDQANASDLLLLAKPLALERHKGGTVIKLGDPGETCLLSWLADQTNVSQCALAAGDP